MLSEKIEQLKAAREHLDSAKANKDALNEELKKYDD